jgi:hypothetical protein
LGRAIKQRMDGGLDAAHRPPGLNRMPGVHRMLLAAAGLLAIGIGIIHSVFGERMIFQQKPDQPGTHGHTGEVSGRYHGILRATWHASTFMGFAIAATLLHYAQSGEAMPILMRAGIIAGFAGSSLAVAGWTKGRHPGWIALAAAAMLTGLE